MTHYMSLLDYCTNQVEYSKCPRKMSNDASEFQLGHLANNQNPAYLQLERRHE